MFATSEKEESGGIDQKGHLMLMNPCSCSLLTYFQRQYAQNKQIQLQNLVAVVRYHYGV